MKNIFGGQSVGVELSNPDFMKLADAYGVTGIQVKSPKSLGIASKKRLPLILLY
jgi:thiamine pyrophosphate-dependent acetolactate synthase large subunit-like protein